jgi:large subunit ribosomal protein L29
MAKNKIEVKGLSDADLQTHLAEDKALLTRLKFNHKVSQVENPMIIRNTRRNIARYMTEINKRANKA